MPRGKDRQLTPEERALWRRVTQYDVAYGSAPVLTDLPELPVTIKPCAPSIPPTQQLPGAQEHELREGRFAGINRAMAQRLHKGRLGADRVLDWHGLNQLDAFSQLRNTVAQMTEQGGRVLLVITGKGRAGGGVLKQQLPHWLNDPSIRPFVLAFDRANPKDSGAFRILLKRRRDGRAHSSDR